MTFVVLVVVVSEVPVGVVPSILKIVISPLSQRKIIRFRWNFVHSSRFWTGWTLRDQKWKSCIGQTPSSTERISCCFQKSQLSDSNYFEIDRLPSRSAMLFTVSRHSFRRAGLRSWGAMCQMYEGGAAPVRSVSFLPLTTIRRLPIKAAGCGLGVSALIFGCWIMTYWMASGHVGILNLIRKHTILVILQSVTRSSVVAETAGCFVSLNISISHSRSLKGIRNDTFETGT